MSSLRNISYSDSLGTYEVDDPLCYYGSSYWRLNERIYFRGFYSGLMIFWSINGVTREIYGSRVVNWGRKVVPLWYILV